jgi:hypothetical protein
MSTTTIQNIFSADSTIALHPKVQKVTYNRDYLISKEVADEFNTYANFGVFPVFADTNMHQYDEKNDYKIVESTDIAGTPGVRSLFNPYGAVLLGSENGMLNVDPRIDKANEWRLSNNVPLLDSPQNRKEIRKHSGCSIKELVEASQNGLMGRETYSYSDFMFCKHLGRVSNNYMITLRRFPLPVDDFIGSIGLNEQEEKRIRTSNSACIGCMVTWMGVSGNNLDDILKYNYKMPFRLETAELQDRNASADENQTMLNGMFVVFDKEYRKQYQDGYADAAGNVGLEYLGIPSNTLGQAPYKNIADYQDTKTKVYGPVDSIRSTYVRADTGLEFEQSITLTFEYELKSYNGVNGKQAMLDLISNILNVTYSTGSFWGGGYKGFAAHQSNIFANLNIFKARGGFTNFVDEFSKDVSNLSSKAGRDLGFINDKGEFSFKDGLKGILNMLNSVGGMVMSGILNKLGRPQKAMYNALLSPAPIGFWHVTIGNPKRPIMSIGNMIITNCEISHTGPLGIDDFPTGLKVTVQLDRGKPRDLRDIEKLYMQGNDRIYTSMSDKVFDMYKNAELYKKDKNYSPVTNMATITNPEDSKIPKPTISVEDYESIKDSMKKYFGTTDSYAIYVPAAEQEYGSGKKKPSTTANKSLVGDHNPNSYK